MRFESPVPTSLIVDSVPHLYNSFALKDGSNCHVVFVSTNEFAAIFNLFLGPVFTESAEQSTFLPTYVGRQWTRLHYLNYRSGNDERFVREKLEVLNRLMSDDGRGHLLLVGEALQLQSVQKALPSHIAGRIGDIRKLLFATGRSIVLTECLGAFARLEESESVPPVEWLLSSFYKDELAVLGAADSISAVFQGQARTLVISPHYD